MKIIIMLLGVVFVVNARGTGLLKVLSYTNSAISQIAETALDHAPVIMTDQTGDLNGDGLQHIVFHDGTDLRSFVLAGASTLSQSYSLTVSTPDSLVTSGNMKPGTYAGDTVATYDGTWLSGYIGGAATFSAFASQNIGGGYTTFGFGDTSSTYAGDELGCYDGIYEVAWVATGGGGFSAIIYNAYSMHNNVDLLDFQHLDMSANTDSDLMLGFDSSGSWLVLRDNAGGNIAQRSGINVNAGLADEALFLQVGEVNAYSSGAGPEEGVIYRKNGDITAWTARSNGSFTAPSFGNIGTGVTEMLIGDVMGDSLEELVVSKGNVVEVWSMATHPPSFLASYMLDFGGQDLALGDMNGDGKQDIIASIPTPPDATLLLIH